MYRTLQHSFFATFLPKSGAAPFFASIIVWGIGIGCFAASLNNYLVDVHNLDQFQRGMLEFFREMPGLLLVFLLALLHRTSDWKILRIGTIIAMVGAIALCIPANYAVVTLMIMIWSTGEHLAMPVRSAIAMQIAKSDRTGASLGYVSSAMHAGLVLGNLLVAAIFLVGTRVFGVADRASLYNVVWVLIFVLMSISLLCTLSRYAPRIPSKRPRLLLQRKFTLFYALELFYGARKQIFLTFGPFVLIKMYGVDTGHMALLMGLSAIINMLAGPWVGILADRLGYRTIMVYDTVILFFVCLFYGYAGDWFPEHTAFLIVQVNFLLDALISTTSLATNLYVRDVADTRDEITSTLSTGISINHLISILAAPLGGWIWMRWGVGTLFIVAALMAIANSFCAMLIPVRR